MTKRLRRQPSGSEELSPTSGNLQTHNLKVAGSRAPVSVSVSELWSWASSSTGTETVFAVSPAAEGERPARRRVVRPGRRCAVRGRVVHPHRARKRPVEPSFARKFYKLETLGMRGVEYDRGWLAPTTEVRLG